VSSATTPRNERSAGATVAVGQQRLATLALLALLLAVGGIPLLAFEGAAWAFWWSDFFWVLVIGATAAKCFRTTRLLAGYERAGWLWISWACLIYMASQLIWAFYEVVLGVPNPIPSPADLGYFATPLCLMVGIWLYRTQNPAADVMLVQLGNFGIIVAAILLANLILFLQPIHAANLGAEGPLLLAYVVIATSVFAYVLFNVWFYLRGYKRLVLMPLLLGVGTLAATDYLTTAEYLSGQYASSAFSNWGYLLAFAFIYWAASEQDALARTSLEDVPARGIEERARQWETLLPPIATAGVLAVALTHRDRLDAELVPYAASALTLFIASLGVRDWWSHRVEARLREQTRSGEERLKESEARLIEKNEELARANRELSEEMQARMRIQEELRQSQKMEALGHLTGGVAHDFNNLLAIVLGNLELLSQRLASDSPEQALASEASSAAERGAALTGRLLAFSRKQTLSPHPIDVRRLLEGMRGLLESTLSEAIRVEIRVEEDLWNCMADPAQLENSILNLAINARDAMSGGGRLVLEASNLRLDEAGAAEQTGARPGSYVAISVRDSGVGISGEILSRVFDPFFTTKEVGAGSGLGLSMVYGFARQSGGYVSIHSEVNMGTDVRICLPRTQAPPLCVDAADSDLIPSGNGESVLLVEDEPAVRRLVVSNLHDLGYDVVEVGDGSEALAILHEGRHFDLLLSDYVLPGGYSGLELAREVVRRRPGVKILLMSGYAADAPTREELLAQRVALLPKPFRKSELARMLRSALEAEPQKTQPV